MINRIKAHFHVYGGHWELAGIILSLVIGGVVTGYVLRGVQAGKAIAAIQVSHVQELERVRKANMETLDLLANRIGGLAQEQAQVVDKVDEAAKGASVAARTAKQAASTAKGAAITAARSAIRVTEVEPKKDSFPEVIEP